MNIEINVLFSFPLKQRTQQQLQDWVNTVKLNDTMKGLVSMELWDSLVTSKSPQLLLAVKQAMVWPLDGDDLNVNSRDFLGKLSDAKGLNGASANDLI